ncbi:MAG: MFS transporter [Mycobacterium sp.]
MTEQLSTRGAKLTRFNAAVVGLCLFINVVEGFDVLVMAYAASGVAEQWSLSESAVGLLLSCGLGGMALGSVFIAPLADLFGRRVVTTAALVMCAGGMVVAAAAPNAAVMGFGRVLTGLGVGATVASLPVIITELTPQRLRGTMIALYAAGLPAGGILGGAVAALLVEQHGWRAPFVVGAVLTMGLVAVVAAVMPESRQSRNHDAQTSDESRTHARSIFGSRTVATSVSLWLAYFVLMGGFYFAASWTPRLLEQSGFSGQQSVGAGVLLNVGGIVGTLAFAALALKASRASLTVVAFVAAGLAFFGMTFALSSVAATLMATVVIGLFVNSAAAGLHSIGPELYSTSIRATGMGLAMGVGRIGALVAPVVAGVLLDTGWRPDALFQLVAWPMLVAAGAVLLIVTRNRGNPIGQRSPRIPDQDPSREGSHS